MANLVAPSALVAAPARTPLEYGLGSVIAWRSGDRFEAGVTWEALTCEPALGRSGSRATTSTVGLPKPLDDFDDVNVAEALSFVVYGEYAANPIGTSLEEAQQRAVDHLLTREIARVEQALWTGDLGNTPSLISGATTLTSSAYLPALGLLEEWIGDAYGSQGVIHMTRFAATMLVEALDARGGRLFTKALGTPVVVGAGYPGTGPTGQSPAAGASWMFASPALVGWRGDVFTSSNRPGDLLDRGVNHLYAVAERSYAVGFDPCGTAAVLATVGGA